MEQRLSTIRLAALPRLAMANKAVLPCKICRGPAPLFDVVDFNKICSTTDPYAFGLAGLPVAYHRCLECGFLFTAAFDQWSEAEFARFIYNDDYVLVDGDYVERRPLADAAMVARLLDPYRGSIRVLDYGGGRGLLAGALREAGFEAESYDPFTSPACPEGRFDVVTCFEVIEHSTDPIASMRDMRALLAEDGCILLGTGIQPDDIGVVRANWWYVGPRNGHVSMHSLSSLALLGRSSDLVLRSGSGLHGFSTGSPSAIASSILASTGRPQVALDLLAPAIGDERGSLHADPAQWHGVEGLSERFRWTACAAVEWVWQAPPLGQSDVRVRLRFVNEIEPGFADRCRLSIDGEALPLVREGTTLTAVATLDLGSTRRILLETPPPLRPSEVNGAPDDRMLGIAIVTRA